MSAHVEHHVVRDHDMQLRHGFYTENSRKKRLKPYTPRPTRQRRRTKADRLFWGHVSFALGLVGLIVALAIS